MQKKMYNRFTLTPTLWVRKKERRFQGLPFFISRGICRRTVWITLRNSATLKNNNAKRIIEIGKISDNTQQVKVMRFATRLKNLHRLKIPKRRKNVTKLHRMIDYRSCMLCMCNYVHLYARWHPFWSWSFLSI